MRIQVTLDSDAGSLTIHAKGCTAATPPARLAATLASIIEATLTEPAMPAQPSSPADQPPAADQPADTVRSVATVADQQPAPTRSTAEAPTPAAAGGAPAAVPAPRGGGGAERDDGEVRARALRLLDDGLTDTQVCAQLGISRGRLLRWDDALAQDDLVVAGGAR